MDLLKGAFRLKHIWFLPFSKLFHFPICASLAMYLTWCVPSLLCENADPMFSSWMNHYIMMLLHILVTKQATTKWHFLAGPTGQMGRRKEWNVHCQLVVLERDCSLFCGLSATLLWKSHSQELLRNRGSYTRHLLLIGGPPEFPNRNTHEAFLCVEWRGRRPEWTEKTLAYIPESSVCEDSAMWDSHCCVLWQIRAHPMWTSQSARFEPPVILRKIRVFV